MEDIVIVSAVRTPVGKFGGALAKTAATDLGAIVIKEALARAKVGLDQVGEVIMGQVLAAGSGQNPARQTVIKAGLPQAVPGLTINAVCGSGLKAAPPTPIRFIRLRHGAGRHHSKEDSPWKTSSSFPPCARPWASLAAHSPRPRPRTWAPL